MKWGPKQPAFGIVGAAVETATAPGGTAQVVDPVAHGFVPRERLRTDSPGPDPALDACVAAARHGDWSPVAAGLRQVARHPDRFVRLARAVADVAVQDETWLFAWLDATPDDPGAWAVHAQSMVYLAWKLRSGAAGRELLPEQAMGFRRVLNQAPAACERATELAPNLLAPRVALLDCARGLSWERDRFREEWARTCAVAPHSVAAHLAALQYWLPRWHGSDRLVATFIAEMRAGSRPGSLLTLVWLEYLFLERVPDGDAAEAAWYRGRELAEALDAALVDLAAAAPDHPYRPYLQHFLAWFLTRAGRYAEAIEQFRAVDGFAGAWPWELFRDPANTLAKTRAEAIVGRRR